MAVWSEGYFTDVQYTGHFFGHLAPGFMTFACLRQGVRPPALGAESTYLELGCGQGFSLNLLAAANPGMRFLGVDFHPGQIANATRLAKEAGLSNVSFEDFSFEQMLALPEGRIPKCDVIALHGVYSWVSPANRGVIVQIIDRLLKPGGLVSISYNTLPGWAPLVPLQRFIAEYVARHPGDAETQVVAALRAAQQMLESKARYFEAIPALKGVIERALQQTPAYLVHEYVHQNCHPLFHAEVARELETARLSFAASAHIGDDLIRLAAPAPLQQQIQETPDGTWRQTLLDYANDRPFRRDIFVRGRNTLDRAEQESLLGRVRFTLMTPPGAMTFEFAIPIGNLKGDPAVYQAIVEALAEGVRSYDDLAGLPALAGAREGLLLQSLGLLVSAGYVHPVAEGEIVVEPAQALNRALFRRFAFDGATTRLATAVAGTGLRAEFTELLALNAATEGLNDPAAIARAGWEIMARKGVRLQKDGRTLPDQAANETELAARIAAFNETKLPLLRRLGVI